MPQILTVEAHEAFWDLKVTWQRPSLAPHASLFLSPWLSLQNDSSLFPFACLLHFLFRLASLFTYDPAWPYLNSRQTLGLMWLALQSCLTLSPYFKQHSRRSDLIFQPGQLSPPGPLNCGGWRRPLPDLWAKKEKKGKESEVAQLCLTLCDPMNCSLPVSSIHGVFQARVLEWIAISFSRGSSQPGDRTQVSWTAGRCFTIWATREATRANKERCEITGFSTQVGVTVAVLHVGKPRLRGKVTC